MTATRFRLAVNHVIIEDQISSDMLGLRLLSTFNTDNVEPRIIMLYLVTNEIVLTMSVGNRLLCISILKKCFERFSRIQVVLMIKAAVSMLGIIVRAMSVMANITEIS